MATDATQSGQAKVYKTQGATELVVDSGGTLNRASGSLTKAQGVNIAEQATFAPAAGGSNVCEVTITVKDGAGTAVTYPVNLDIWLSDAVTGAGLTATTASGAVAAKTGSQDLVVLTTKKAIRVQTSAAGVYVLSITDTAKTGFYVAAQLPGSGVTAVSAQLVTANYG